MTMLTEQAASRVIASLNKQGHRYFATPESSAYWPADQQHALAYRQERDSLQPPTLNPIDMILHCPACGMQHIDAPSPDIPGKVMRDGKAVNVPCVIKANDTNAWTNPPHRSHLCHGCGHVWRPADVPTNGVAAVKTRGKNDSTII